MFLFYIKFLGIQMSKINLSNTCDPPCAPDQTVHVLTNQSDLNFYRAFTPAMSTRPDEIKNRTEAFQLFVYVLHYSIVVRCVESSFFSGLP